MDVVGSAANGAKADQDWHGIVAFFHPFWYAMDYIHPMQQFLTSIP